MLPEGNFEMLLDIANLHYEDMNGKKRPILTMDEIQMLSIRKGSLDEEERLQIEAHVVHTVSFLQQIPWTSELRNVPEIARGHHEKLNGTGYPYKLSAPEIPVQTRMMTISDIFDALAAADRPYKKAVSIERALEILDLSVHDGELDPACLKFSCPPKSLIAGKLSRALTEFRWETTPATIAVNSLLPMKEFYISDCVRFENQVVTTSFLVVSKQAKPKRAVSFIWR